MVYCKYEIGLVDVLLLLLNLSAFILDNVKRIFPCGLPIRTIKPIKSIRSISLF